MAHIRTVAFALFSLAIVWPSKAQGDPGSGDGVCGDVEPGTFVWETLTGDGVDIPLFEYEMDVNDDLELYIHVELEYLGLTSADDHERLYGTTYVLDFESFDAHESAIYQPGLCQNRVSDSFYTDGIMKDFSLWWLYSDEPALDGNIGEPGDYLAYPPTDATNWEMSMSDDNACGVVVYDANFTWNELVQCVGIQTIDYPDNITLSGVFYVNVVSPVEYDSDTHYYRVYQLLSAPFAIAVSKSVYVLGESGINVLAMSIIAVYKENQQQTFKLVVLTESQNYLRLTRRNSSYYLFSPDGDATITTGEFDTPEVDAENGACLDNKLYICSQLWEIKAENVDCKTKGIDFSGEYTLAFDTGCREVDGNTDYITYCDDWLEKHPDIESGVQLTAKLTWRDDVCDPLLFQVEFVAEMKFFTDSLFSSDGGGSHLYQVGEDTIYVEIDTAFPGDTYTVFDATLINVWICTFDPLHHVMDIDADSGSGGCFDPARDGGTTEDNTYLYHIYSYDAPIEDDSIGFTLIGHPDDSDESRKQLRFYFVVPHKVIRDKLYIHAQMEVTIIGEEVSGTSATQMDHFINDISVTQYPVDNNPINDEPEPAPQEPQEPFNYNHQPDLPSVSTWSVHLSSPWVIAIGIVLAMIISVNTAFWCYFKYCQTKRQRNRMSFNTTRRAGYASVKDVDSEDFHGSEINIIDVCSD